MLKEADCVNPSFAADAEKEGCFSGFYETDAMVEIEAHNGVLLVQLAADAVNLARGHGGVGFVDEAL